MRIEVHNRTETSDFQLQNSTNNLINRQEHRRFLMLSWLSTGAQGTRRNTVRTMVLQGVAAANPPLPPNSTRGLTPGLVNPLLGPVPGNLIPWPALGPNQGRLRVGLGRRGGAGAIPALVPAPPQAPAAAPALPLTAESSGDAEEGRSSGESQSSEVRLEAQQFLKCSTDLFQDIPLRITRAMRKGKGVPTKRKPSSKQGGTTKKHKLRAAESAADEVSADNGEEEEKEGEDEEEEEIDAGLAEAYRTIGRAPIPRGRQPTSRPTTTVAPPRPAGQNINAITGPPSSNLRRRPEAPSSHSDIQPRRQASAMAAPPPPGTRYDIAGNPYNVTYQPPPPPPPRANNTSYPTVTEPFEPTGGVYVSTPDGSHVYFTGDSGVPYHARPWPASSGAYRTAFTPNQRSEVRQARQRTSAYPPPPPHPSQQQWHPAQHQSVCSSPISPPPQPSPHITHHTNY